MDCVVNLFSAVPLQKKGPPAAELMQAVYGPLTGSSSVSIRGKKQRDMEGFHEYAVCAATPNHRARLY